MLKIIIVVGTRPDIVRLCEVIKKCKKYFNALLVHTGQNYDYNLNDVFFHDFDLEKPDIYLNINNTNCGIAVGETISKTYDLFQKENPDCILILGDVNSALCSYSAKRLKIPIFHIEGGNRSFDPHVPEEINRKIIDHLSDVNICYMEHSRQYLLKENVKPQYTFVCGSPITEVFHTIRHKVENSTILEKLNIEKDNFFVWSVHRENNVDDETNFAEMIYSINKLSETFQKKVVFGIHPRTRKKCIEKNITFDENKIILTEPFGIVDYYKLLQNCCCVISDSGTISEESNILPCKAILLRSSTEHPEAVDYGNIILANIQWKYLKISLDIIIDMNINKKRNPFYTDSNFSEKVIKIIAGYPSIVNKYNWLK